MTDNKPCGWIAPVDPPLYCGYGEGHKGPHTWQKSHTERVSEVTGLPTEEIDDLKSEIAVETFFRQLKYTPLSVEAMKLITAIVIEDRKISSENEASSD